MAEHVAAVAVRCWLVIVHSHYQHSKCGIQFCGLADPFGLVDFERMRLSLNPCVITSLKRSNAEHEKSRANARLTTSSLHPTMVGHVAVLTVRCRLVIVHSHSQHS